MEAKVEKKTKDGQDTRWRFVNRTMRLHGNAPHALIETLHSVQEYFGFLDTDALKYVANALHVPLSLVYGVATFYHHFTLRPPGEHTCVVCKGTACYIGGAANILDTFENKYGIGPGETTPDGKISLVTARCLGSCGLAPAVVFDGEVKGRMKPDEVLEKVRRWTENDSNV